MNTKTSRQNSAAWQGGFTLLELMIVCAVLAIVLGAVFQGISTIIQRSQAGESVIDSHRSRQPATQEVKSATAPPAGGQVDALPPTRLGILPILRRQG